MHRNWLLCAAAVVLLSGSSLAKPRTDRTTVAGKRDGGSNAATATVISSNPYLDEGNTQGKGNDAPIPGCLGNGDDLAEDAWYRLDLSTPARLDAWITCVGDNGVWQGYDSRLAILDDSGVLVACNDDEPGCVTRQSRISGVDLEAGTWYVVVDGYDGASGPYQLQVQWADTSPCTGSSAATALNVDQIPYSVQGTTYATCDDVLIACEQGGTSSGPDMWYRLGLASASLVDVRTICQGSSFDTRLAILDEQGSQLFCNDDDPACGSGQSRIEGAALQPGYYYIVVDSATEPGGVFQLEIDAQSLGPATDLLPDLIVDSSSLYDHDITGTILPGRDHLRLTAATANVGAGELYFYGVQPANPDGSQDVRQRIWRSNGSFSDRTAGQFVFHPDHDHVHLEGWIVYRIREILPGGGVGAIVAEGEKTSFCVLDLDVFDSSLPGFDPQRKFDSCTSTIQGLSVGWSDVYSKSLPGQNIDITLVGDGTYWLEAEVDPDDIILESDETNNFGYVQVSVGTNTSIEADPYEPNHQMSLVLEQAEGGPLSPNLGPVGPQLVLEHLSVHALSKDDYFRFFMPATGGPDDFVRIDFVHEDGDLDLTLLDGSGVPRRSSSSVDDGELISLSGRSAGWYYARVYGYNNARNPDYTLTIDPSSNGAPQIAVVDPPSGNVERVHGDETYEVRWSATDPEAGPMWVTVFVNTAPAFDGNEVRLSTAVHLDADLGFYVVNTSELPLGTYWVHCRVTDGGEVAGAWSSGTLSIVDRPTTTPPARTTARLLEPRPNPFNPSTVLRLELDRPLDVTWSIFDLRGARVRQLHRGRLEAGQHARPWDARDASGRVLASGVYFQVVDSGDLRLTGKLVLIK